MVDYSPSVRFRRNRGLAAAFMAGIDAAVKLGADYIVNTDADNQYSGQDIEKLLTPLIEGKADICIGDRNIQVLQHLTRSRKFSSEGGDTRGVIYAGGRGKTDRFVYEHFVHLRRDRQNVRGIETARRRIRRSPTKTTVGHLRDVQGQRREQVRPFV